MSETATRIDRHQREALHGLLLQRLSGIEDPGLLVERGDFEAAERLGNEFAADVRLLMSALSRTAFCRPTKRTEP